MVTKTASEIIDSASLLAGVNNSDLLEWKDHINYLNNFYKQLYAKSGSFGDQYFVKEMELTIGSGRKNFVLPDDFYQLLLVGYRGLNNEIIPIQRAPNSTQFYDGYRLINNEIRFTTLFFSGPLVVRYLPVPKTITYPRMPVILDINKSIGNVKVSTDVYKIDFNEAYNIVAYNTINDKQTLHIKKLNEEEEELRYPGSEIEGIAIVRDLIYVLRSENIDVYSFDETSTGSPIETIPGDYDFSVFHKIDLEYVLYKNGDGNYYRYNYIEGESPLDVTGVDLPLVSDIWNYFDGYLYRTSADIKYIFNGSIQDVTKVFSDNINDIQSLVVSDPYIYVNYTNKYVKGFNGFEGFEFNIFKTRGSNTYGHVLVADTNDVTGYGVVFRDFKTGLYMLNGFTPDTLMDFSNNLYFTILEAQLAIAYRTILDADTLQLTQLYENYNDQLQLTLSRDNYQPQRINNTQAFSYW